MIIFGLTVIQTIGAPLGKGAIPTSNAVDTLTFGEKSIEVSICDVANMHLRSRKGHGNFRYREPSCHRRQQSTHCTLQGDPWEGGPNARNVH